MKRCEGKIIIKAKTEDDITHIIDNIEWFHTNEKNTVEVICPEEVTAKDKHKFSVIDWQYEVGNGDTMLGYTEWLNHKLEAERN